jgi:hypothetical protein
LNFNAVKEENNEEVFSESEATSRLETSHLELQKKKE